MFCPLVTILPLNVVFSEGKIIIVGLVFAWVSIVIFCDCS